jgi:citrate lyase subunit beta/citryl-CoA lyase
MLFVPGDRPERFAKAIASGADAVIIDLEDAVAPQAKAGARAAARDYLGREGHAALLRINAPGTKWEEDDLSICSAPGVLGVVCPKTENPTDLARIAEHLRPGTALFPLIETAKGLRDIHAIAATDRIGRLLFGSVDLSLDLNLDPSECEPELSSYRALLVLASRAAGLAPPVDGVTLDLQNEAALLGVTQAARRAGFGAKLCLHPSQIAVVHQAFAPSAEELDWARRVLVASCGQSGAFSFEGRMVDAPVLARARLLTASIGQFIAS